MPQSDPGIEVEKVGVLKFPLKPKAVKSLVEQCQIAPFGKGTKTLVDTKVRKTFELSSDRFRVSDQWDSEVSGGASQRAPEYRPMTPRVRLAPSGSRIDFDVACIVTAERIA